MKFGTVRYGQRKGRGHSRVMSKVIQSARAAKKLPNTKRNAGIKAWASRVISDMAAGARTQRKALHRLRARARG